MLWRTRRDNKKSFIVRPKGGKTISMALNKAKDEPLTSDELKKVLHARKIDEDEIVAEEEIKDAQREGENVQGRLISVHPSNPELDNIFVKEDTPHIYDESELNKSLDLREEQNRMVAQEKGLEIQEDIEKLREKENEEKAMEKKN